MTRSPSRRALGALTIAVALTTGVAACAGSSDSGAKAPQKSSMAEPTTTTKDGDKAPTTTKDDPTDPYAAPEGEQAIGKPVPSSGCGTSKVGAVDKQKVTLPDSDRFYLLTTPPEHDGKTPLPLVLDFHGLAEGAEVHSLFSQFGPYAAKHGFVLVSPNGTGQPVAWKITPDRKGNADIVYTDQILDKLEADLCIDTSRVYSTGLSNGAFMSSVLACVMPERIAAIAPVAGLIVPDDCKPSRPVPVLAFHGTEDPILTFNGTIGSRLGSVLGDFSGENPPPADGATTTTEAPLPPVDLDGPGFPANAADWAKIDGCTGKPTDTDLTPTVIQRTWTCPVAAPVIFDIVKGGGHSWPGSEFGQSIEKIVGPTDMSVDATDTIWKFFERFQLPST